MFHEALRAADNDSRLNAMVKKIWMLGEQVVTAWHLVFNASTQTRSDLLRVASEECDVKTHTTDIDGKWSAPEGGVTGCQFADVDALRQSCEYWAKSETYGDTATATKVQLPSELYFNHHDIECRVNADEARSRRIVQQKTALRRLQAIASRLRQAAPVQSCRSMDKLASEVTIFCDVFSNTFDFQNQTLYAAHPWQRNLTTLLQTLRTGLGHVARTGSSACASHVHRGVTRLAENRTANRYLWRDASRTLVDPLGQHPVFQALDGICADFLVFDFLGRHMTSAPVNSI